MDLDDVLLEDASTVPDGRAHGSEATKTPSKVGDARREWASSSGGVFFVGCFRCLLNTEPKHKLPKSSNNTAKKKKKRDKRKPMATSPAAATTTTTTAPSEADTSRLQRLIKMHQQVIAEQKSAIERFHSVLKSKDVAVAEKNTEIAALYKERDTQQHQHESELEEAVNDRLTTARSQWEEEKAELLERIRELESGASQPPSSSAEAALDRYHRSAARTAQREKHPLSLSLSLLTVGRLTHSTHSLAEDNDAENEDDRKVAPAKVDDDDSKVDDSENAVVPVAAEKDESMILKRRRNKQQANTVAKRIDQELLQRMKSEMQVCRCDRSL